MELNGPRNRRGQAGDEDLSIHKPLGPARPILAVHRGRRAPWVPPSQVAARRQLAPVGARTTLSSFPDAAPPQTRASGLRPSVTGGSHLPVRRSPRGSAMRRVQPLGEYTVVVFLAARTHPALPPRHASLQLHLPLFRNRNAPRVRSDQSGAAREGLPFRGSRRG